MLRRHYADLGQYLKKNHALIIFGPRQVGKTTLLQLFLSQTKLKYRLDSGDNIRTQHLLGSQDFKQILEYAEGYDLIVIDEAQQIPHIGIALKILVDQVPNLHVIATGSSSFDLSQSVGEPLTGRKTTLTLYPLAQLELLKNFNKFELREALEEYLIFGAYPEIVVEKRRDEKIRMLKELVDSYLLKDILALE
ncbi:MAG: AAA family ATPase, partial [Chlamydiia bacterium]|nr:AAA family ATPase [Chlamydiia bacterium]